MIRTVANHFFPGMSVRLISQAIGIPTTSATTIAPKAIVAVWSSGRQNTSVAITDRKTRLK